MSYLVLARKYRPQTFDEVLGQESITRILKNAITQDRVAHAFLFSGPRGVGKTTMARILAKSLNCQSYDEPTTEPCGTCGACTDIAASSAVDVLEIDGASNTGVDNIRELRETVRYMPASHRYKIYIVDEVHMLSVAAFNALLKTLEEPPPHVKFMFATTEPHKLPATILSRCQRYDFHRVPLTTIIDHLRNICEKEGVSLPDGALAVIAREAEGSVRDSLSLLDQVTSFGGEDLSEEDVLRILGVVDRTTVSSICSAVLARDPESALEALSRSDEVGHDIKQLSKELLRWFRNLVVIKIAKEPDRLVDLPDHELEQMRGIAAEHSLETIERLFDMLARFDEELARAGRPGMLLEMTLVKMALMPPLVPVSELVARLEELEHGLHSGGFVPPAEGNSSQGGPLFSGTPSAAASQGPGGGDAKADSCGEDATWDDFLAFVEKNDGKIHGFLAKGRFAGRSGREWRLNFPANSPIMERLKGNRNSGAIAGLMKKCFGDGHRLVIGEDVDAGPAAPKTNQYKEEQDKRQEAMEDQVVHYLLEKLGGDIEEIKIK